MHCTSARHWEIVSIMHLLLMNWHACCGYFTRLISHSLLIASAHKTPGDSLSRPVTEQPDIRANECSKGDNIPKMIQELHDTHTHTGQGLLLWLADWEDELMHGAIYLGTFLLLLWGANKKMLLLLFAHPKATTPTDWGGRAKRCLVAI